MFRSLSGNCHCKRRYYQLDWQIFLSTMNFHLIVQQGERYLLTGIVQHWHILIYLAVHDFFLWELDKCSNLKEKLGIISTHLQPMFWSQRMSQLKWVKKEKNPTCY